MIIFSVSGTPVPKERPRKGKGGNFYTPERTRIWEQEVGWSAKERMIGRPRLFDGDLQVTIAFSLPDDKIARDLDNLSKSVLDGMNKIVYHDDRQITRLHLSKRVSSKPGITVKVERI